MERQEWLDSLKIGDKVAVDFGRYPNGDWQILAITKITPKRKFTAGDFDFNKHGRYSYNAWHSICIQPITEKILTEIEENKLEEKYRKLLRTLPLHDFSLQQKQKIIDFVETILNSKDVSNNEKPNGENNGSEL